MRMKIHAQAKVHTNTNPLPEAIVNKLAKRYLYMVDIGSRLRALPVIPKGRNVGKFSQNTPHDNAMAYSKSNKHDLYVGYFIHPDRQKGGMVLQEHSFCVDPVRGHVIEPTEGFDWTSNIYYVGQKVDSSRIDTYLHDFNKPFTG